MCTNKLESLSRLLLGELGLLDRFAAICGGDTFAVKKPDGGHVLGTIERAGGVPARAVMVGDSEENDGGARDIGCRFVLVDPLPVEERPTGLLDAVRE